MKIGPDYDRCYAILKQLISEAPNFFSQPKALIETDQIWLAKLKSCLVEMHLLTEQSSLSANMSYLSEYPESSVKNIKQVAFNALSIAEMKSDHAINGAFIAVGAAFDFHVVLNDILRGCKQDVFLIDPYMDSVVVSDVAPSCPEHVSIRFLSGDTTHRPSLKPAVDSWNKQYGSRLQARIVEAKSLHDRLLIIDQTDVFLLTQSVKDFAKRAVGAVQKMELEAAGLKAGAYANLWSASTPL